MSQYKFKLVFYQNITPLHIGCGQDIGLVDNPIIREKTTQFPFIPGSSIRGVLRDKLEVSPTDLKTLFGPEATEGEDVEHAGCISIHDAKILFFPVRTDKNLFHWITCQYVIDRFNRDIHYFGSGGNLFPRTENLKLSNENFIGIPTYPHEDICLEEFPFKKLMIAADIPEVNRTDHLLNSWLTTNPFNIEANKVLLVSDDVFLNFVQNATIIMQHNRLTSAKTVETGALFSVESVPPEAIFYGLIGGTKARNEASGFDDGNKALEKLFGFIKLDTNLYSFLNIGGDESTGLGVTKLSWN